MGDYARAAADVPPCIRIVAGPNGAGKTTFAREYLPKEADCRVFLNADLIAAGLSPFAPDRVAIQAGRLMLESIALHLAAKEGFALETTLSGLSYARQIPRWRAAGYRVELYFLSLASADLAVQRVAERVRQGGHDIPEATIRRRFESGERLFTQVYRPLVDQWHYYDNSGEKLALIDWSDDAMTKPDRLRESEPLWDGLPANADQSLRDAVAALRRAAERARQVALQTGTDLIVMRDGRITRVDPRAERT